MVLVILLVHAAATWSMVGLIWFVQVAHYPLFASVGAAEYARYQHRHQRLTTLVVGPFMIIELLCAAWLVIDRHNMADPALAWSGFALLSLIWISTAFIQVPCHQKLTRGFDPLIHRRLVLSNWLRTLAWNARGVIALLMLRSLLRSDQPSSG